MRRRRHYFHPFARRNAIHRFLHLHNGSGALQAASINLQRFFSRNALYRLWRSRCGRRRFRRQHFRRRHRSRHRSNCRRVCFIPAYQIGRITVAMPHQNSLCQISPQSHCTEKYDRLVFGYLRQTAAHLIQRNINSSRNSAEREFFGCTGVNQHYAVLLPCQFTPRDHRHCTADYIGSHVSGYGNRIFGR